MSQERDPGASVCPRCGRDFTCGMKAGARACWCARLPPLRALPAGLAGCLCPSCLAELSGGRSPSGPAGQAG